LVTNLSDTDCNIWLVDTIGANNKPEILSSISIYGYCNALVINENTQTAYLGGDVGLALIDLSTPNVISQINNTNTWYLWDNETRYVGMAFSEDYEYLFAATGFDGFKIIDISNSDMEIIVNTNFNTTGQNITYTEAVQVSGS